MTAHHTPRHRAAGSEGFGRSPWPSQPIAVIPSPRRPADDVIRPTGPADRPAVRLPPAERPTVLTVPAPPAAADLGRFATDAGDEDRGDSDGTARVVATVLVLTALLAASIVLVVLTLAGRAEPAPVAPDRVVPAASATPPVGAATAAPGADPIPVLHHAATVPAVRVS